MAAKQDWFKNTVFVIVADHCALVLVKQNYLWINTESLE
jgi:phosphoglycerol transferase MdoB-like AlkP superfamily enzyme